MQLLVRRQWLASSCSFWPQEFSKLGVHLLLRTMTKKSLLASRLHLLKTSKCLMTRVRPHRYSRLRQVMNCLHPLKRKREHRRRQRNERLHLQQPNHHRRRRLHHLRHRKRRTQVGNMKPDKIRQRAGCAACFQEGKGHKPLALVAQLEDLSIFVNSTSKMMGARPRSCMAPHVSSVLLNACASQQALKTMASS